MREDNISGDEKKSSGKQLPGKVNFPPILRGGGLTFIWPNLKSCVFPLERG